ncbi:dimethyladenosine transferase [Pirellula staleyi DSM 6068]|uniref:Ribosomal RNA small subunit methyltransferase A n=1 Tax=Pirellula staleyi (strain ATCC 27377 / DSM 6068 / ICPB 4128) TaxID=530564 RepID=D2R5T5_PIRSD|nr:16S rRNA (adenine(1518)-N(6)/adenine(1519)-N(6))-dimethyltransferase RsmA [Pirellula staleyi]ADB17267.1 dimethyladenosine transferase [Pirellula staleyi DSM 6068]
MTSARQTVSYLTSRFREAGIRPEIRHGQNFLVDLNLLDLLADAAQITEDDVVLEVGTGLGSLTSRLAERAAEVVTIEIDERLAAMAEEELEDFDNVTLVLRDALESKHKLSTEVMDIVRAKLAEAPGRRFKLAANLPYNVATLIISNLLASDPCPVSMTVTIQKELADRIVAPHGTKDYSGLSIWVQSQCEAKIVRIIPPQVFWPPPKVHSAILHLEHSQALASQLRDPAYFHSFIRAIFLHRRKFLRGVLAKLFDGQLTKNDIDQLFVEKQLTPETRAEELPVATLVELSHWLLDRGLKVELASDQK